MKLLINFKDRTQRRLVVDEREKRTWDLDCTQRYYNIFENQKELNVLMKAFWGRRGQRRLPSEGGRFKAEKKVKNKNKKIAFQLFFHVFWH